MINKFPKKAIKKWNRFGKQEKAFILYCIILTILIIKVPIVNIKTIDGKILDTITTINAYTIKSGIIIILSCIFLICWNSSFRFKRFVHIMFGLTDNDSLINFGVLWLISCCYIALGDAIHLIEKTISLETGLNNGYQFIGMFLIAGLTLNLSLAISKGKQNKRKNQIINIIHSPAKEESKIKIKGLFE